MKRNIQLEDHRTEYKMPYPKFGKTKTIEGMTCHSFGDSKQKREQLNKPKIHILLAHIIILEKRLTEMEKDIQELKNGCYCPTNLCVGAGGGGKEC
jgi:hypothetical protein